MVLKRLLWV
ncbi:hypothetical protein TCSYLVIO_000639, partial [Trypanosoma cruzi]